MFKIQEIMQLLEKEKIKNDNQISLLLQEIILRQSRICEDIIINNANDLKKEKDNVL